MAFGFELKQYKVKDLINDDKKVLFDMIYNIEKGYTSNDELLTGRVNNGITWSFFFAL